jgi:hypothetical protein
MSKPTKPARHRRRRPKAPRSPWTAHVDGSYDPQKRRMTYAVCVYDAGGRLILRRLGAQPGGCSAEAEARAALLGICAMREQTGGRARQPYLLIGDHRGIIQMLADPRRRCTARRLAPFIDEAKRLLAGGRPRWVPRKENFAAHWTADRKDQAVDGLICDLPLDIAAEKAAARHERLKELQRIATYGHGRAQKVAQSRLLADAI